MTQHTDGESAEAFATVISETSFADLPSGAVGAAKKSILDTVAVMAGAVGSGDIRKRIAAISASMGKSAEASIIGQTERVPALMAAFANGCLAHQLDFDDIDFDSVFHPSGALVPALLALAERNRGSVTGRDLITAVALGQDLGIRLARAVPSQRKPAWNRSAVISTFAVAAASARLIGLDREGILDALGHGLNQAAGTVEVRWGANADVGGYYCGYPAKAGVFSALMAEAGIPSVRRTFDGPAGFFQLYFSGKSDRNRLLDGLGTRFTGADCAYKPWAACAATNTYVLAILHLIGEHDIVADDIERISLHVGDYALKNCEPVAARQAPATATDGKFSLPYCVAAAAVSGDLGLAQFRPEALVNPAILALARKVVPLVDARYDIQEGMPPGAVTVDLNDGRQLHRHEAVPYGHPSNPVSWEQLKSKAMDCFALGQLGITPERGSEIIALLSELEQVEDLTTLQDLLRAA